MSGILNQLLGKVLGGGQGGQPNAIVAVLQQALAGNGGGIPSIISRFQDAGLGSQAQSWVGTGPNMPITADQIGQVFSTDQIEQWAQQAGTTPDKMRSVLAEAMPHAVDHATPGGQVPPPDATPDLSALVGRLFGTGMR